ncbi:beta-galactosidase [Natronospora cellulosivora (SeqCode)]
MRDMINLTLDLKKNFKAREIKELAQFTGTFADSKLGVNSHYFTVNDKGYFPIMGEMHYSRYPKEYWEESILKARAGGVQILASYIFWIHHEEIKGEYDWKDCRNLRDFIKLCAKQQMPLVLRIGPWAHGECRNGGFPDWLLSKDIDLRSNDSEYLAYVKRFYQEIYQQAEGFLAKDGGPIIGIQIENEYGHCGGYSGQKGLEHMNKLKEMAVEIGFDVPFYTSTAWGGAVLVEGEMLPVYGAYASTPWAQHSEKMPPNPNFVFDTVKDDTNIGTDLSSLQDDDEYSFSVGDYPYATAELGGGNQITAHRRPFLSGDDIEAMSLVKLGSGANLLGYYMYHGGTNPEGKLSTLQESTDTGYNNDLPVLSYDFQAPLGEYGKPQIAYHYLKRLHLFLEDFGEEMAYTETFIPDDNPSSAEDIEKIRYAIRYQKDRDSGFLFINNYQRGLELRDHEQVNISLKGKERDYLFSNMKIIDGLRAILPFNMNIRGARLYSANVQALCKLENKDSSSYFFFNPGFAKSEFLFAREGIREIEVFGDNSSIEEKENDIRVVLTGAGTEQKVQLYLENGRIVDVFVLSKEEALNAWKFSFAGSERLFIGKADFFSDGDNLIVNSEEENLEFKVYPDIKKVEKSDGAEISKISDIEIDQLAIRDIDKETKVKENIAIEDIEKDSVALEKSFFATYKLSFRLAKTNVNYKVVEIDDRSVSYKIDLSDRPLQGLNDLFLEVNFAGDSAELYINDKLSADCFYNGRVWKIGLKRFKDKLADGDIRIKINPLYKDDEIYLEKEPVFIEGKACRLISLELKPEYSCQLKEMS